MKLNLIPAAAILALLMVGGCATAPQSPDERQALRSQADATLDSMVARDPGLRPTLDRSYGYVVFPEVGKGGAIIGGAYGRGVVYEQGQQIGFADLTQASIGAQLGGQTFSELILFENEAALQRLKAGNFDVGAQASAVALKAGAAAATRFENGVAIYVMPRGGLMFDVSVAGQQVSFEPTRNQTQRQTQTRNRTETEIEVEAEADTQR